MVWKLSVINVCYFDDDCVCVTCLELEYKFDTVSVFFQKPVGQHQQKTLDKNTRTLKIQVFV